MVQSIERAMQIVDILQSSEAKPQWSISDISERADLPLSTTHRILSALMKFGLVAQNPETKLYKVGPKWMEVGLRLLENNDLRTIARPVMERLARELKESIYLSIPEGTDAIIIERIDSPLKVRVIDNLGERIPLHIGAANKTMLANMDPSEAEAILAKLLPEKRHREAFLAQLPAIKRSRYSVSYGEKTEGTASVASPIVGFGNKVLGALSVGVLSYSITEERLQELAEKTIEGAKDISTKVGGS